jgi:phage terminase large subunit-like protein
MTERDIARISCDPWNGRQLTTELQQAGLPIYELQQSMVNLSAPTKEVERLVLAGRLQHDRNPVLRWNVRSARADVDANGNVRLSKRRSTARIDGLAAVITGLSPALVDNGPSIYETQPVLTVDL